MLVEGALQISAAEWSGQHALKGLQEVAFGHERRGSPASPLSFFLWAPASCSLWHRPGPGRRDSQKAWRVPWEHTSPTWSHSQGGSESRLLILALGLSEVQVRSEN